MGTVKHQFLGDSASGEQAIARMERRYADLENRIAQVSRRSRRSQQSFTGQAGQWVGGLGRIAAGYVGVNTAIQTVMESNRQYFAEVEAAAAKVFDVFQQFRTQSGLQGLEAEEAQGRIGRIAFTRAVPLDQTGAAATQLVSSGFSAEDASGEALDKVLQVLQASNLSRPDVNPADTIRAVSAYLEAQGLEKNAANLEQVGVRFQRLFKSTDVQLGDLQKFAKESVGLRGLVSSEEQFAAFDIARGVAGNPESAAVFLRNFAATLGGSSESASTKDALAKLGLQSQDVDFVGEDLGNVLDRLAGGVEKLPERRRLGVLTQLFERRNAPLATALIRERGKIDDLVAIQRDVAGFADDVRQASSGRNSVLVRQQIRKELQLGSEDQQVKALFDEADQILKDQGRSVINRYVSRAGANLRLAFSSGDDDAVDAALRFGFDKDYFDNSSVADVARARVGRLNTAEGAEQALLLREIRDDNRRGKLNPRGNSE